MRESPAEIDDLFARSWPPQAWCDVRVVVAVSGGADSVALLRLLDTQVRHHGGQLAVAHIHHHLRIEADDDQCFVQELAGHLGYPIHTADGDVRQHASLHRDGLEAAARTVRLQALRTIAEQIGARYVVLAHTADDQAETILHRMLRGTGLAGLAGMRRARPLGPSCALIRPLLSFRRQQLRDYLQAIGQPFREDASNADTKFTRNRLRHDLLPKLAADYNPQVVEALTRLGALAGEAQGVIDRLVDDLFERVVSDEPERVCVSCGALRGVGDYVVRQLMIRVWQQRGWPMQSMGHDAWSRLDEAVRLGTVRSFDLPGRVQVTVDECQLVLTAPRGV